MSLKARKEKLKRSFLDQMPTQLDVAEKGCIDLQQAIPTVADQALKDVFRVFHSLKGTSATFGLKTIESLSRQGEDAINAYSNLTGTANPDQAMQGALAKLHAVIATLREVDVEADPQSVNPRTLEDSPTFNLTALSAPKSNPTSDEKYIYLCDDETAAVEHLCAQLKSVGYAARYFNSTASLLQAVDEQVPSAIVMDIVFPCHKNRGTEVIANLRAKLPEMPPVVFVSGREDYEARLKAVQAGGDAYFVKPLRSFDLIDALDRLTSFEKVDPIRVLIIDDEPNIANYHASILEDVGMLTRVLVEPSSVLATLDEFRPDLVLMDFYMPGSSGHEVAEVIRQIIDYVSIPIIYLSVETDAVKQAIALRVGAEGFLTKPIKPEVLINEVMVRAERMRFLRTLMVRDSLTGLFNHTFMRRFLENAMAKGARNGEPGAVAMIDIDYFKKVNDHYGHQMGDQVLVAIARLLKKRLRDSDAVGRYGGEEFILVLTNISKQKAIELVDEIRQSFSELIFESGEDEFYCTFSAGVGSYPPDQEPAALLEQTDLALYEAKRSGRNRVLPAEDGVPLND